jgi:hypothetical protein
VEPLIVTNDASVMAGEGGDASVTVTTPVELFRLILLTLAVYVALLIPSTPAVRLLLLTSNGIVDRLTPLPHVTRHV